MWHTKLSPLLGDANNHPSTVEEIIDQNETIAFSVNETKKEDQIEESKKSILTEQLEEKLMSNLLRGDYDGVKQNFK